MGNKNSGRRKWVKKIIFICKNCGEEVLDYASNRKESINVFCSRKCSAIYRFKNKKKCPVCGEKVRLKRNTYCSHKCRGKMDKKGKIIKCKMCKMTSYFAPRRIQNTKNFYCSIECKQKDESLLKKMRAKLRKIRLMKEGTRPEKVIMGILKQLKVVFVREKQIKNYFIDFYLPRYNLCIEVDGDYWHGNKNTNKYFGNKQQKDAIKRDLKKNNYLKRKGFKLLRIWENDIKNNKEKVYDYLKRAIQ